MGRIAQAGSHEGSGVCGRRTGDDKEPGHTPLRSPVSSPRVPSTEPIRSKMVGGLVPWGTQQSSVWMEGKKVCSPQEKSPLTNVLALMLYQPSQSCVQSVTVKKQPLLGIISWFVCWHVNSRSCSVYLKRVPCLFPSV